VAGVAPPVSGVAGVAGLAGVAGVAGIATLSERRASSLVPEPRDSLGWDDSLVVPGFALELEPVVDCVVDPVVDCVEPVTPEVVVSVVTPGVVTVVLPLGLSGIVRLVPLAELPLADCASAAPLASATTDVRTNAGTRVRMEPPLDAGASATPAAIVVPAQTCRWRRGLRRKDHAAAPAATRLL
jgi:hypothetical protein